MSHPFALALHAMEHHHLGNAIVVHRNVMINEPHLLQAKLWHLCKAWLGTPTQPQHKR